MLSIEDIKSVSFRKAGIGGYKPEDVDAFIDQVLITMEQLRKEKSDLIKKMDILATRVEEYRADEDSVRNAMLSAQRVADSTIKEARAKAARMIEESENIAKSKLYDLNVQIKQQKKQYTLLLAECNRVRDEIINNCNKHIVIAKELPSLDKTQQMAAKLEERYPTDNSDDYERAEEFTAPLEEKTEEAPTKTYIPDNADSSVAKPAAINEPAADDVSDVNLIEDFSERDNFDIDRHAKTDNHKSKGFGALKFGDDYNVDDDLNDDDADK
ncbi:MAG: DivIVA domain-containing protein [Ruminococcus sp.]